MPYLHPQILQPDFKCDAARQGNSLCNRTGPHLNWAATRVECALSYHIRDSRELCWWDAPKLLCMAAHFKHERKASLEIVSPAPTFIGTPLPPSLNVGTTRVTHHEQVLQDMHRTWGAIAMFCVSQWMLQH